MSSRWSKTLSPIIAAMLAMIMVLPALAYHEGDDAQHAFANDHFENRWEWTDLPVATNVVDRTWMWGPGPYTEGMMEPYVETPGGLREVQYFDKARMEINNPFSADDGLWFVTNGRLVVEMVEGFYQVGDVEFDHSPQPAQQHIAGDPDNSLSPTYADISTYGLLNAAALETGTVITQTFATGEIGNNPDLASHGVTAAHHVQVPGISHNVASVFWDFMNSETTVWDGSQYVTDSLFLNPFYATGYPITEAYWASVFVAGTQQDVLWQCFERRCLTYTPQNEPGWQVEAGNVGQHYYQWRHQTDVELEMVDVYLTMVGDAGEHGIEFGCDDSLVAVEMLIEQHDDLEARIAAAVRAMFGMSSDTYNGLELYNVFENQNVDVASVTVTDTLATINITGELAIGGICDEPRVIEQIRHTALQFEGIEQVVILRDGGPLFEPQDVPDSGIIAIFDVNGEQFRVWVTNEQTIEDILALEAGESDAAIPSGTIHHGPGAFTHNVPWSWHLDPEDVEMVEAAIGLCNATLSAVEANVDEFVDIIGSYCPWSAQLIEVRDYRDGNGNGPELETVNIHLVAIGDEGEVGAEFGCDDSLVPVEVDIVQHEDVEARIMAALDTLLTYESDDLYNVFTSEDGPDVSVSSVVVFNGSVTIDLTGDLTLAGVCDEPRVEEQIRSTVLQFDGIDEVTILFDGVALPWEEPVVVE